MACTPAALPPAQCPAAAPVPATRFGPPAPSPPADKARLERLRATLPAFDKAVEAEFARAGAPGMAAGIVADGRLFWARGLGVRDIERKDPVTPDTVFRIGSVTKTFTGLALLMLRDEGKLLLDDPVAKFLPELGRIVYPTRDSPPITLRNLVTHTAGLVRDGPLGKARGQRGTGEELLEALDGAKLERVPGLDDQYSNLAASLEGIVVSRASRTPYRDFVTKRLLMPLGMTSTAWDPAFAGERVATGHVRKERTAEWTRTEAHDVGLLDPAGGLWSTVPDLARYAAFQLAAWPPRDDPETGPVRRSTVRESHRMAGPEAPGDKGFGVHWVLRRDCDTGQIVEHNGSLQGFKSALYLLPASGVGVILLGNGVETDLDGAALRLLRLLESGGDALPPLLASRLEAVKKLFGDPEPRAIEATFSAPFVRAVGGVEKVQAFLGGVGNAAGACGRPKRVRVLSEGSAELVLACDRGRLAIKLAVTPDAEHPVSGLSVRNEPRCE